MKKPQPKTNPPSNPLIDQHPVDTLVHIQSVISFLQEYTSQNTCKMGISPKESRIHTGHYAVLKLVNDALEYEIERLEGGGV